MKLGYTIRYLGLVAGIIASYHPCVGQEHHLTAEKQEGLIRVMINDQVFAELIHGETDQYGAAPRPYLFPINGPTGVAMTRNFPMIENVEGESSDHPHHRSLWFAHPINGVDFWTQGVDRGVIKPNGEITVSQTDTVLRLSFDTNWIGPDDTNIAVAKQEYCFQVLDDGSRAVDFMIEISPGADVDAIVFEDTKEGTMAVRTHPALRLVGESAKGQALNSEGDTDRELWGKRAKWVAYWGEIEGKVCGIAIFDHPKNLRHPTWWHARDYGLVAANPFGIHDFEKSEKGKGEFTLKQRDSLELQYRFVFFVGSAMDANIAEKYERWENEAANADSSK